MVRRALSLRRNVPLDLQVDTHTASSAATTPGAGYVTIPILSVTTTASAMSVTSARPPSAVGRPPSARLPHSRHHQLRRSSSVRSTGAGGMRTGTSVGFGSVVMDDGVVEEEEGEERPFGLGVEDVEGGGRIEEEKEGSESDLSESDGESMEGKEEEKR